VDLLAFGAGFLIGLAGHNLSTWSASQDIMSPITTNIE
jgi:hypothetical protein